MTDPINTQNRTRNTAVSSDNRAAATAKNKQTSNQQPAATNREESDSVELSSTTLIEELSEQVKNIPQVNEARVEAVKEALSNGEYQPDAEVIARKYSEIEKLLP